MYALFCFRHMILLWLYMKLLPSLIWAFVVRNWRRCSPFLWSEFIFTVRSNESIWIYGIHNWHQIHHQSATFLTFSFEVFQQVPCPWPHATTSISFLLLVICRPCINKTGPAIFHTLAPKSPPDCYRIQFILQQVRDLYAQSLNLW